MSKDKVLEIVKSSMQGDPSALSSAFADAIEPRVLAALESKYEEMHGITVESVEGALEEGELPPALKAAIAKKKAKSDDDDDDSDDDDDEEEQDEAILTKAARREKDAKKGNK